MIKNYFKIAWRNLWKNKIFSAINVVGLAIGMAACIIIMVFVFYEKSFDNFHSKNIDRLNEVQKFEGMVASQKVALSMFPMGPTLKKEFPEIKNFTRIHWTNKYQMTYGDKRIYFSESFFVDSTFLQLFDFKLVKGDRETVLQKPNSAVLTEASAKKLFGKGDPIGKTITHYGGDTTSFIVTGILQNVPQNSQLQFDALYSFSSIYQPWMFTNWGGNWLNTYFQLAPNTNVAALEKKFPAYLKKYMQGDNWKNYELFLLPLKKVHAAASDIGLDYLNYQKFDKNYTSIFLVIALVELFLPYVNNLSQRNLQLPLLSNVWLFLFVILGTVIIGVLAGLYPAAYLSSFQAVRVLKGSIQTGKNKSLLRNILVVAQFSSAIFLMIATIFAVKQLRYMQDRDPGFGRDQVVTIPLDEITYRKFDVVKQQLLNSTLVSAVTGAQDVLGSHLDQSGIEFRGDSGRRELTSTRLIVDHDYLKLYKIPVVTGRNFSDEPSANGREYIINESLAKELLKDNPKKPMQSLLGKHFGFDSLGTIVGIAKDFNFNSLHYKIETMFIFNQKDWGFSNISVKINGSKASAAIAFIQSVWQKNFPDHPFEYQFLDDNFSEVYRADTQVSSIVGILAGLAIIISCLGLFGLASYSAERRVKEVGIRKVLGASVQNIVAMLSKDFLKYVLIAALIAWPLAWFSVYKWLQDYAYRIDISWWIFLLAVLVAIIIALITISFQAIKAAVANPVKSLRTE